MTRGVTTITSSRPIRGFGITCRTISAISHSNEVGWQDTITVTVNYQFPLLPGPGRMLARYVVGPSGKDTVAATIQNQGGVYTYPLQASATIGNEGEKSVVTYVYQ